MAIPTVINYTLKDIFGITLSYVGDKVMNQDTSYNHNNVFKKFITLDISQEEFEIPVMAKIPVEKCIMENIRSIICISNPITEVVLPLYRVRSSAIRKSASTIVKELFSTSTRMMEVENSKGDVYYGCPGLIMDSQCNPIFMCTVTCRLKKSLTETITGICYSNPTIHINPKVFLDTKDMVHKFILKDLIPFYIRENLVGRQDVNKSVLTISHELGHKANIVISDTSRYIREPAKPSMKVPLNESVNELLVDNVDELLGQILK